MHASSRSQAFRWSRWGQHRRLIGDDSQRAPSTCGPTIGRPPRQRPTGRSRPHLSLGMERAELWEKGMKRAEYLAQSLNRSQPWKAEGISRAQWYRRQRGLVSSAAPVSSGPVSSMPAEPVSSTVALAAGHVSAQSSADAVAIPLGCSRIPVSTLDEAFRVRAALFAEAARHEQARAARLRQR
jgi:hypothetical protein